MRENLRAKIIFQPARVLVDNSAIVASSVQYPAQFANLHSSAIKAFEKNSMTSLVLMQNLLSLLSYIIPYLIPKRPALKVTHFLLYATSVLGAHF